MDRETFVAAVEAALGPRLQHATVASARQLVAWFDEQSGSLPREGGRLLLEGDPAATLESSTRAFLDESLRAEPEEARQRLWMALLDVCYGMFESEAAEDLGALFEDLPPPGQ